MNPFSIAGVTAIANDLNAETASEYELVLVGDSVTQVKHASFARDLGVKIAIRNFDLLGMVDEPAHKLHAFLDGHGVAHRSAAAYQLIVHALCGKLSVLAASTATELSREGFASAALAWLKGEQPTAATATAELMDIELHRVFFVVTSHNPRKSKLSPT